MPGDISSAEGRALRARTRTRALGSPPPLARPAWLTRSHEPRPAADLPSPHQTGFGDAGPGRAGPRPGGEPAHAGVGGEDAVAVPHVQVREGQRRPIFAAATTTAADADAAAAVEILGILVTGGVAAAAAAASRRAMRGHGIVVPAKADGRRGRRVLSAEEERAVHGAAGGAGGPLRRRGAITVERAAASACINEIEPSRRVDGGCNARQCSAVGNAAQL